MALRRRRFTTFNGAGSVGGGGLGIIVDLPPIGGIDLGPIDIGGGGGGGPGPTSGGFPCAPGFTPVTRGGTTQCVPIGGGGADPIFVDPSGFAPTGADEGCAPFFTRDPFGVCRFDIDPGPGQGLPGGNGAAGAGLTRPRATSRTVLECPRFADGKTGILWMNALTGDVICLPRRTSGKGFGLIRKNKPRAKPFISAAEKKLLTKMKLTQNRAKRFAQDAGFTCKKK